MAALRKLEAVTTGTRSPAGTALVSATGPSTPNPTPAAAQSALVQHRPVAEQRLGHRGSRSPGSRAVLRVSTASSNKDDHESQGLRSGYCPKPSMMRKCGQFSPQTSCCCTEDMWAHRARVQRITLMFTGIHTVKEGALAW